MADLTTKYLGLNLRNPLIVGSSGLTDNVENMKEIEKHGAGALVVKSVFEEQIIHDADSMIKEAYANDMLYSEKSETLDYIDMHIKEDSLVEYVKTIKEAKNQLTIPVIASINCISTAEWTSFANKIEEAGADALEINIALLPSDMTMNSEEREEKFLKIISDIRKHTSIPLAIKLSPYFSNLAQMIKQISETGVQGIVLFNRFYTPDFDIHNFSEKASFTFSHPSEMGNVLRWVAIMSDRISCDTCASTGIHTGEAMIKQLLAGAKTGQVVSALYKNGLQHIQTILNDLIKWMDEKGYQDIDQFRGKMTQHQSKNPAAYERIQFMKYFSGFGEE